MRFFKDPAAKLPYLIDWASFLGVDTIFTSVWEVPSGLTGSGAVNTNTTCTIFLAGGSVGDVFTVANKITTAAGLIDRRLITIVIQENG